MKRFPFILLLTVIPLFFMGCKEINLTIENSGQTVKVSKGTIINVELVSNQSTGNIWRKVRFDEDVLMLTGEPTYQKDKSGRMGAPGKVLYIFKAVGTGETDILMEYGAAYDKEKAPVKQFNLKVIVE
jgi:predicted secreted protein